MIEEAKTEDDFSFEKRLLDLSTKSQKLAESAVRNSWGFVYLTISSLLFNIYLLYVILTMK